MKKFFANTKGRFFIKWKDEYCKYIRANQNNNTSKKIGLVFHATATAARSGAAVRYRTNGVNIDICKEENTYLGRKFVGFDDWHSITEGDLTKRIPLSEIIESPTVTSNHPLINELDYVFDNRDTDPYFKCTNRSI